MYVILPTPHAHDFTHITMSAPSPTASPPGTPRPWLIGRPHPSLFVPPRPYYPVPPNYTIRSPHHNPQLPQLSNFSVPQCIVEPTFSNIEDVIFPDIRRLTNKQRKFTSEDDMTSTLLSVLSRYGVNQFSISKSVRNHDPISNSLSFWVIFSSSIDRRLLSAIALHYQHMRKLITTTGMSRRIQEII